MKRLVLFLDGTWSHDWKKNSTNIVRLREILADSLSVARPLAPDSADKEVYGKTDAEGVEHIVFYQAGVGTGLFGDRLSGAAFGVGLTDNVRRAYKFLSYHYQAGDQIYVFGFSRGAFTARSLVGYIGATGLLCRDACTPEREEHTWSYYRTPPADRSPGLFEQLTPYVHSRRTTRVACLGVFDTVGALGVPLMQLRRLNRHKFEFHDVELSSISDVNLHALAIDERRGLFQPAVWSKPKFKHYAKPVTEQVWFSGSHGDVGGGKLARISRPFEDDVAADDLALDWMIKRVRAHTTLPLDPLRWKSLPNQVFKVEDYRLNDSMSAAYFALWRGIRRINATRPPRTFWARYPDEKPYSETIREMIHVSAIERWKQNPKSYAPSTLTVCFSDLRVTYSDAEPASGSDILIVDWDGVPLEPDVPAQRARANAILEDLHSWRPRATAPLLAWLHRGP